MILGIVGQLAAKQKCMSSYLEFYRYNRGQRDHAPMKGFIDNRVVAGP
jgi:hypothetical protein